MSQDPALLYIRELPGGGYVAIEGQPVAEGAPYHAALAVERRSDPERRDGHAPPVVVEAEAPTQSEAMDRLIAIANSNVAVAAALLRWTAGRLGAAAAGEGGGEAGGARAAGGGGAELPAPDPRQLPEVPTDLPVPRGDRPGAGGPGA